MLFAIRGKHDARARKSHARGRNSAFIGRFSKPAFLFTTENGRGTGTLARGGYESLMRRSNAVLYPFTESVCEKKEREIAAAQSEGRSRKSKRSVLKRLAMGGNGKKENVTVNGDRRCNVTPPCRSHVRANSRTGG